MLTRVVLAAVLLAILTATVVWAAYAVTSIGGFQMPLYAWVAMFAGGLASVALAAGLMFLVFYSSRHGFDQPPEDEV